MSLKKKRSRVCHGLFSMSVLYMIYLLMSLLVSLLFPAVFSGKPKSKYTRKSHTGNISSKDRAYVVEDNEEALGLRIAMLNQAKKKVFLSTFDIRPGDSWDQLAVAFLAAADRGVKIRILVDGMYGMLHMKHLPQFYAVGLHSNIQMKYYNPVNLLKPWKLNGRLHDKLFAADDRVLLAGGRNTFDYFLKNEGCSISSDREVLVFHEGGDSSDNLFFQVSAYFEGIWRSDCCKICFGHGPWIGGRRINKQISMYRKKGFGHKEKAVDFLALTLPVDKAFLICNPTHPMVKEPVLFAGLTALMMGAKQSVRIQTPYVNFSKPMYRRMRAVSKKVPQTEILINAVAVGDNMMASADYLINRKKIWETGFDVYEYFGSCSSHGKSILIDDHLSAIGSFNFDMRSTYLNTETMIVMEGRGFQKQLAGHVDAMIEQSLKVDSSQGSYVPSDQVTEIQLEGIRHFLYRLIGPVLQLIRILV